DSTQLAMHRTSNIPPFFFISFPRPPTSTLFPYTTLFRSGRERGRPDRCRVRLLGREGRRGPHSLWDGLRPVAHRARQRLRARGRSEEHTSELQSRGHLVCRLLLEKKKKLTDVSRVLYHMH